MTESLNYVAVMSASLGRAIEKAGGYARLAKQINDVVAPLPATTRKQRGHVSNWAKRGACPPDQVLRIEAATGVSRHKLRPDVFGFEPIPAPEELQAQQAAE